MIQNSNFAAMKHVTSLKTWMLAAALMFGTALTTYAQVPENADSTGVELVAPEEQTAQPADPGTGLGEEIAQPAPATGSDAYAADAAAAARPAAAPDSSEKGSKTRTFKGLKAFKSTLIGVNVGGVKMGGPAFVTDYRNNNTVAGYGIFIEQYLGHTFGALLEAHFQGELSGDKYRSELYSLGLIDTTRYPNYVPESYRTKAFDITLSGTINLGNLSFISKKPFLGLYARVGAGFVFYQGYARTFNGYDLKTGKTDSYKTKDLVFPIGVGAKIRITNDVTFKAAYDLRIVDSDKLDRTYANNNVDAYSYISGGISVAIGKRNKPSIEWNNPVLGLYNDVANSPKIRKMAKKIDELGLRMDTVEGTVDSLRVDTDGDGVVDLFDKQGNTPAGAMVDPAGRALDSDGDGVIDLYDKCPFEKGLPMFDGCKTSVGGGANLPPADKAIVDAINNDMLFVKGSSKLRRDSQRLLNGLADMMKSNPNYRVRVTGHACTDGTDAINDPLSEARANNVKRYLVKKGVSPTKVEAIGVGSRQPLVPNDSEMHKRLNRVVKVDVL